MNPKTMFRVGALLLGLCCFCAMPLSAQAARLQLDKLEKLSSKAAAINDVTLDGPLLQLAIKFIEAEKDPDAQQLREVIKDLKGIYVKNFEFDSPGEYSQADVDGIRAQLTGPGWSRIVESRNKRQGEHDEIYIMKDGEKIAGMAILVAEARELTVVNIVGQIALDKVALLEDHFSFGHNHDRKSDKHGKEGRNDKE